MYEGPADEFGWLVTVPGLPEVKKGSMECFYELSQLTQGQFSYGVTHGANGRLGAGRDEGVSVIKIETVGAYEVAILAAGNAAKLTEWLEANGFAFPREKLDVLDSYVKREWYFVAIKIDPNQKGFVVRQGSPKMGTIKKRISAATRKKLANGELQPLVISFASEKCVFPLAISAVNGKPSEISLYVLSAEPLMSRTIFDMQFAVEAKARKDWLQHEPERRKAQAERMKEFNKQFDRRIEESRRQRGTNSVTASRFQNDDPADPQPPLSMMREIMGIGPRPPIAEFHEDYRDRGPLVRSMEVGPTNLVACIKDLPRLAHKSWWLTKQVEVFAPEEMRDLEFEPAIPLLTGLLRSPEGLAQGFACLRQFGARAVPAVLEGMKSSEPEERRLAGLTASEMKDPRLGPACVSLLADENPRTRAAACHAMGNNWDEALAPLLVERLSDPSEEVRSAACSALRLHPNDSRLPVYRKLLEDDTVAAGNAVQLADIGNYSRAQLVHLFSSTNLPVVSSAFVRLRYGLTPDEVAPLLTNTLPMARLMGLGELVRIRDTAAIDRIVSLLHDPNEAVRWRVRSDLRWLTGQKLGADPAAYEKWWKENRETFTPPPANDRRRARPSSFEPGQ